MEYRKLGHTGLSLSALGLGASSLGGVFHAVDEAAGIEAVFTALELGINYIDVSPYYGHLKAEHVLGKALKEVDRNRYYLSSKIGRYGHHGQNTWNYSAQTARTSVYESIDRLHANYLDVVFVHDIEFADLEQVCTETLPALHALKSEGVVRHIGLTNLNLRQLRYVIEHTPPETVACILSFCHYTLHDDALLDYLDFFEAHQTGVINASPYSMGLLTQKGPPAWHPAPQPLKRLAQKAVWHCKKAGVCIEQLAIAFSTHNPRIATTLFSTTCPENVKKTVAWANQPIDWALVEEVKQIFEPGFRDTWVNS